jgi:amidohydrolase
MIFDFDKEIIDIRRHIHRNPELGCSEFNTAKFIESKLKSFGISFKRIGKTGNCYNFRFSKR